MEITLGAIYQDRVTGAEGVAMAETRYLTGEGRVALASRKLNTLGKPEEWQWFDGGLVERIGSALLLPA